MKLLLVALMLSFPVLADTIRPTMPPVHVQGSTDIDVILVHLDASGNTVESQVAHIAMPMTKTKVQAAIAAWLLQITTTAQTQAADTAVLKSVTPVNY